MFAVGVPELVVVALVLVVGALVLTWRPRGHQRATREVRLVGATRVVGILVGLVAARIVTDGSTGPTLAPTVFGTVVLLAVLAGETWVRPRRRVGPQTASLGVRRLRDHLPRVTWAVAAVLVLTGLLLVATTLTASRDTFSGDLSALSCRSGAGTASAGPYPGAHYSGPLAAGLLLVVVVAGLAAREVVLRPRGTAPEHSDDDLRRRSLGVVVAATGVAVGLTFLGVAGTAAGAMSNLSANTPHCAASWVEPASRVLGLSCLPVAVLVMGCALQLLRPRPVQTGGAREPADAGVR